jgi:predicted dehydrogenase
MMRHFRECILGKSTPICGGPEGILLMQMLEGIYESSEKGRSIALT